MKITYCAAASADEFIASEDGSVTWLDELNIDPAESDLESFFENIDGLVMGRMTYDFVFHYGSWPYQNKPTWICTRNRIEFLDGANLIVVTNVDEVLEQAMSHGINHLWLVGGGRLASSFLDRGLISHLSISVMPVMLRRGIKLFEHHNLADIPFLDRTITERSSFQQVEIRLRDAIEI